VQDRALRIRSLEATRDLFGPDPLPIGLATAGVLGFADAGKGPE
jgi:hypothetical protein